MDLSKSPCSRYINDNVINEFMNIAGSIEEIESMLNNPDKGVKLINYNLVKAAE